MEFCAWLESVFSTDEFMPHGHCYYWKPSILWLHIVSDALIALAYYSIPAALFYFVRRRRGLKFRGIFILFGLFILACGTTHVISIYTIYKPQYFGEGLFKLFTAIISAATAVVLWPLIPKALAMPTAEEFAKQERDLQEKALRLRFGAEIQEKDKQIRTLIDSIPNGIVMVDAKGTIILCNSETEKMFGYNNGELIQRNVRSLIPDRVLSENSEFAEGFTGKVPRQMGQSRNLFGRKKDGDEIPIEIGLNPVEMADGTYIVASIVDITERKNIEDRLQRTNAELSRKNSEMEQFVYTVSHDLKSPLVTAASFIGFLKEDLKLNRSPEVDDSLMRIEKANHRMRELIEDLLELSRAGRFELEKEKVLLKDLIDTVIEGHSEEIRKRGLKIEMEVGSTTIEVDASRMQQVFENLLTNALKYASKGSQPLLRIFTEENEENVKICFRDSGPGIDQAYHEKIFGLFQRLQTDEEGTGVGLSIVSRIIEVHGGTVWVESSVGNGASFWMSLPKKSTY
jgi:two-component system, LuxR family, sensor kinase FixL